MQMELFREYLNDMHDAFHWELPPPPSGSDNGVASERNTPTPQRQSGTRAARAKKSRGRGGAAFVTIRNSLRSRARQQDLSTAWKAPESPRRQRLEEKDEDCSDSHDTGGEDEEGEEDDADSELLDFVDFRDELDSEGEEGSNDAYASRFSVQRRLGTDAVNDDDGGFPTVVLTGRGGAGKRGRPGSKAKLV